jgi:uncharacterized Zn finger protein
MAMTANKQEPEDSSEPVVSEMYCPRCDEIVWAMVSPDFYPVTVECENCGYTELA